MHIFLATNHYLSNKAIFLQSKPIKIVLIALTALIGFGAIYSIYYKNILQ